MEERIELFTFKSAVLQTKGYRLLRENVNLFLKDHDLSVTEWIILSYIFDKKSVKPSAIAAILDVERPLVTKILGLLSLKGLVKEETLTDKRSKEISLSNHAMEIIPIIEKELSGEMETLLDGVARKELSTYFKVLETIIKNCELN